MGPGVQPCVPFGDTNDRRVCEQRQRACLEYVDRVLGLLLERFMEAWVLICSDHGDCWGEDGLWEHGIHHPAVLTVPLQIRLAGRPIG
jgi:arylsulfatase A-like enzyme